jgi:hypothetical protein
MILQGKIQLRLCILITPCHCFHRFPAKDSSGKGQPVGGVKGHRQSAEVLHVAPIGQIESQNKSEVNDQEADEKGDRVLRSGPKNLDQAGHEWNVRKVFEDFEPPAVEPVIRNETRLEKGWQSRKSHVMKLFAPMTIFHISTEFPTPDM